ncbi:hypothetical protein [Sphingopyxis sp. KK2]|uniref:hypothetical protein n=1 Tax=Sphingopyxis sp. KK2 TaxID=1855727 RepID=UPI00097E5DAF|nr:hypothetical protein [Sphingopyxis sp. KK2]
MGETEQGEEEIAAYNGGPAQRRSSKPNGWTKARRRAFLAELAHSCNVSRAHKAADMGERGAYALRQRDPQFARQWQEALELGYGRLEMALARRALEVLGELELDERAEPLAVMTVEQAIAVLSLHRRSVQQGKPQQRRSGHVATQEETDAVLLKKIAMIKRQRAIGRARLDGGTDAAGGA